MNIVRDLGEDVFPEPEPPKPAAEATTASAPLEEKTSTVESQEPPSNAPAASAEETPDVNPSAPTSSAPSESSSSSTDKAPEAEVKTVTTEERKPLKVPDTVHVRITPETLKDYVGPQVYYKDRLFKDAPPSGVSTGLGYLGNGSGAVMPIEAVVSASLLAFSFNQVANGLDLGW